MFRLFFFMFVFLFTLWCFELCLVSILCCSHCIMFVLYMHTSLCYCALLIVCSDDHLLCYVIIVTISLWLFWCMIKLLICFTSCLLDRNLLVTLYLSFYYLFCLEGLMCSVQVFRLQVYMFQVHHSFCDSWLGEWYDRGRKRERVLCYINYFFYFAHSSWLCLAI